MNKLSKVFEEFRSYKRPLSTYVNASSNYTYEQNNPENVLVADSSIFHSLNQAGAYLQLDLIKYPVFVEFVKLQIDLNQDPTNWVIEASESRSGSYKSIYTNSGPQFCEKFKAGYWAPDKFCYCSYTGNRTFEVKKGLYYSLRIRLTGESSCTGEHYLILNQVELIGKIMMRSICTCNKKRANTISFVMLSIFVIR